MTGEVKTDLGWVKTRAPHGLEVGSDRFLAEWGVLRDERALGVESVKCLLCSIIGMIS